MRMIIILALMAITAANSSDFNQDDVSTKMYEKELRELMEKIRAAMPDGIPSFELPPLEPLEVETVNLNLNMPNIVLLDAIFEKFKVKGIQAFDVNGIHLDMEPLKFSMDITIKQLKISAAHYNLNAIIDNDFLEIYGNGEARIEISDLNIIVEANLTNKGNVVVTGMSIKISIRKVKSYLEGLMGGGEASKIMNEVVGDFLPAVIEHEQDSISNYLGGIGTDFANNFLRDLTVLDLINIITGNRPFP